MGFRDMANTTTFKTTKSKLNSGNVNTKSNFATSPLRSYGNVNIDNITDDEYEVIQEIEADAKARKINWKAQSFVSMITTIMTNKQPAIKYAANHKGLQIEISSDIKGKTHLIVKKGLTRKVIVDTFITSKPIFKHGSRIGTSRSVTLYSIYKTARYQVDGELIAS